MPEHGRHTGPPARSIARSDLAGDDEDRVLDRGEAGDDDEAEIDRAAARGLPGSSRLSPDAHGWLDYGIAGALAMAPALFPPGTPRAAAVACYALTLALWLLSVFTRYPFGLFAKISLQAHCALERMLAPLLFVLPWLANFADSPVARGTFWLAALALVVMAWATDQRAELDREASHEPPVDRGASPARQGP